ncbi:MAG: O-antigen ligase family protein [Gemmatimonadales bacterium]
MTTLAFAALWIFVFSVPWERIFVLPGVSIIPLFTGAAAIGLAGFSALVTGRIRRWHPVLVAALLYVGWTACVLMLGGAGPRLPSKFWTWTQLFLMMWMIWELAATEKRHRGLLMAYVLGAYVAAFDTLLIFRRQAGALRRFAAGGADPNDLAMILALGVPMAWYLALTTRRPLVRWICRAYLPLCVVCVGLTGSRGGMVVTTLALLVVPFTMTKLSAGRLATAIVMLGIGGVLAVVYTPETLIQRLSTTGSELEGGRIGGRGKLWVAGLEAFTRHPIIGYGTGGYKQAIFPILGDATQVAHNSYISVLVEQGSVGFILYMSMFGAVYLSVLRLPLVERRFAFVLMVTLGVAMLPLTWEDRRAVWFVLPTVAALTRLRLAGMGAVPTRQPAVMPGRVPVATRQPPAAGRAEPGQAGV